MSDERQAIDEYRSEAPASGLQYFTGDANKHIAHMPADLTPEKVEAFADLVASRFRPPATNWTAPFGIKYVPNPKQLEAHLSDKPVRVLVGGRGSGKTTCMFMELLKQIENGDVQYAVIHCDHVVTSRMYAQALEKIINEKTNLGLTRRHYDEFAIFIGLDICAKVVFAHGDNQWAGIAADLTVAVTGNGDLAKVISRMPRSNKYIIDVTPGEMLMVDFLGSRVDIFDMGRMPVPCLCCENPPSVDVPGLAAIEETLRQAKARELGDAASDPFEMEAHEER